MKLLCRCKVFQGTSALNEGQCGAEASQEDLLCDPCRDHAKALEEYHRATHSNARNLPWGVGVPGPGHMGGHQSNGWRHGNFRLEGTIELRDGALVYWG